MLQPQAPELEETILGACLIEKEGMALIDELLKPEMFYVTRHQLIYAALQAMFHTGTNIDILTVTEELRKRGKLDDAGGPFYITQLSSRVASSAHLEYHARIVHQKYIRREMIVGFSKLLTLSGDETIDLTDTLVDGHNLLDRLEGACGHNRQLRDMDTLMQATLTEAEGRMQKNKDGVTGIPTGLAELDKMTGQRSDHHRRPSGSGKNSLCTPSGKSCGSGRTPHGGVQPRDASRAVGRPLAPVGRRNGPIPLAKRKAITGNMATGPANGRRTGKAPHLRRR